MEFNQQNFEKVVKILDANNISFNRKMLNYFNETEKPKTKEVEDVATRAFDLLSKAAVNGVNAGFSKNKKDIYDLSDVISSMASDKGESNVKNSNKELDKLAKSVNIVDFKPAGDAVKAVKDELDYSIKGINYLLKTENYFASEENKEVVKAALERLVSFKERLGEIINVTSQDAIQQEFLMFKAIQDVSNLIANRSINEATIQAGLNDAEDHLNAWINELTYNEDDYSDLCFAFDGDGVNDLYRVCKAVEKGTNNIEAIKSAYAVFKKNLMNADGLEELEAKKEELEAQISQYEAQMSEIKKAYKNGEMSKDKALYEIQNLMNSVDDYKDILNEVNMQIEDINYDSTDNISLVMELDDKMRTINKLSKNLIELYYILGQKGIDFNYFIQFFGGASFTLSPDKLDQVLEEFAKIDRAYEKAEQAKFDVKRALAESRKAYLAKMTERREQKRLEREKEREERNQLRNRDGQKISSAAADFLDADDDDDDKTKITDEVEVDNLITSNNKID